MILPKTRLSAMGFLSERALLKVYLGKANKPIAVIMHHRCVPAGRGMPVIRMTKALLHQSGSAPLNFMLRRIKYVGVRYFKKMSCSIP